MEDLKWLLRKCGLLILLLLIFVIVGVICWGKMHEEEQKVAEEVWEPPVEIENSEAETEEAENAETSTESAYWFIPQASDCLISDEEKEQLRAVNQLRRNSAHTGLLVRNDADTIRNILYVNNLLNNLV